tara:strand:+ start:415 stop:1209 length:795 start_codon:yes stop_codon:yes gene_type:complete
MSGTKPTKNVDSNLTRYENDEVVSSYAKAAGLHSSELFLFNRFLRSGMSILDMGVGGGRTTSFLSEIASKYVGADYSLDMVKASKHRFPELDFRHCDATKMGEFFDEEFDAFIFSFNGIDYIRTDEERAVCLSEIQRVLKPGGIFIFSSHNARVLGHLPSLIGAKIYKIPFKIIRAFIKSIKLTIKRLTSRPFYLGEGYVFDRAHGGLVTYVSTPETLMLQLSNAGFEVLEIVGNEFPATRNEFLTSFYYYACKRKCDFDLPLD